MRVGNPPSTSYFKMHHEIETPTPIPLASVIQHDGAKNQGRREGQADKHNAMAAVAILPSGSQYKESVESSPGYGVTHVVRHVPNFQIKDT